MSYWKLCSSCKKEIGFNSKYYTCSVSTCNGQRTGYVFCSMQCFERHIPGARHRDASAVINTSPSENTITNLNTNNNLKMNSNLNSNMNVNVNVHSNINSSTKSQSTEDEILIVVSKLKNYIKDKSDMNTSADVAEILSHMVRAFCDEAIQHARNDGRKTVMARDFKK